MLVSVVEKTPAALVVPGKAAKVLLMPVAINHTVCPGAGLLYASVAVRMIVAAALPFARCGEVTLSCDRVALTLPGTTSMVTTLCKAGLLASVAVIVCEPTVRNTILEKRWRPASPVEKVYVGGNVACGSELLNWTVPVYSVAMSPTPSRRVTVSAMEAPATVCVGAPLSSNVAAGPACQGIALGSDKCLSGGEKDPAPESAKTAGAVRRMNEKRTARPIVQVKRGKGRLCMAVHLYEETIRGILSGHYKSFLNMRQRDFFPNYKTKIALVNSFCPVLRHFVPIRIEDRITAGGVTITPCGFSASV